MANLTFLLDDEIHFRFQFGFVADVKNEPNTAKEITPPDNRKYKPEAKR